MAYDYLLTYDDYLAAQRAYYSRKWTSRLFYIFLIWICPLAGCSLVFFELYLYIGNEGFDHFYLILGLVFGIGMPLTRIYQLRGCWRSMNPTGNAIPAELEWNDEQVVVNVKDNRDNDEERLLWPSICGLITDSNITLLFIEKKRFIFIPNRALPQEAWDDLRTHYATLGRKQC